MQITLTPEQEKLIADQVSRGRYASAQNAVAAALELLRRQEEEWLKEERELIREGFDQLERGECVTLRTPKDFEALVEDIERRGRARSAGSRTT